MMCPSSNSGVPWDVIVIGIALGMWLIAVIIGVVAAIQGG